MPFPLTRPTRALSFARWLGALGIFLAIAFASSCEEKKPAPPASNPNAQRTGLCSDYKEPGKCSGSCRWNSTSNICENASLGNDALGGLKTCSQKGMSDCRSDSTCQWRNNTCADKSTQTCGDHSSKSDCSGDTNCMWEAKNKRCSDNPCLSYDATDCKKHASQCKWNSSSSECTLKSGSTGGSTCDGVSSEDECLASDGCAWTEADGCLTQDSDCADKDESTCGDAGSCRWDATNEECVGTDAACDGASDKAACRTLADCSWRSNRCMSLGGACAALATRSRCQANTSCQWYVTMNRCGSALGAGGGGVDPDRRMKQKLTLAAGLGALQGFLGGGGWKGALSGALNRLNSVLGFSGSGSGTGTGSGTFGGTGSGSGTGAGSGTFAGTSTTTDTSTLTNTNTATSPSYIGGGISNSFDTRSPTDSLGASPTCDTLTVETACRRQDACQWNRNTKACEQRY